MKTTNLNTLDLTEFTGKDDPGQHCRATFPLFGAHGTESIATVYFELDPGDTLGRHTDSAEELLLVLEGEVEAEVGGETGKLTKGEIALVPKMIPHNMKNSGSKRARILGIFGGANHIVATFENTWLPVDSNTVDTSKMAG
jgi:quercetin dioxygenase-like cupin family protein